MSMIRNSIDSNSTRIRQQNEQEQQEKNQDSSIQHHDDYHNNYNYTTRSQACSPSELPGKEIMDMIVSSYKANINEWISGAAASIIEDALKHGMEPATVILAIQETGMAPRPSPYYLAAVLRNWAENGVVVSKSSGFHKIRTTQAKPWWR